MHVSRLLLCCGVFVLADLFVPEGEVPVTT